MSLEIIQEDFKFLHGLVDSQAFPKVYVHQHSRVQHGVLVAPRIDELSGIEVLSNSVLNIFMIGNESKLLCKFLKMKSPTFLGSKIEHVIDFYYEKL